MRIPSHQKQFQEIPLAWSQLMHQKVRLLVALSGIAFADILIFMQLGFKATMFDGVTRFPENMTGDLFLLSETSKYIGQDSFPTAQLYRAGAIEGVQTVAPLYYTQAPWLNPWNDQSSSVTVLAFNPSQPVVNLPEVIQQLATIEQPDTVLFDSKSLASLGDVASAFDSGELVQTKVGDRKISVGGIFALGSSLFKRGHIITSDVNYLRIFGASAASNVQVGVVTLEPSADAQQVTEGILAILPDDIVVLNREEFIALEQAYWASEPAGVIFNFGTIMGFVVGVVIVYQVLYSDVNDHLPEYATLKAIGYSNGHLLAIVFQEAVILGIFGFAPGFLCSTALYSVLGGLTRIAVPMRVDVAIQVLVLTIAMCLVSAAIASRKLQSADPADVF